MKPGRSDRLDHIGVSNEYAVLRDGEGVPRIPLVTNEEMEDVLLPHMETPFRQHKETPFGPSERRAKLGLDCTSNDARALLDGSYDRDLDQLSDEARCWLQQLQHNSFKKEPNGREFQCN
jgi:hypothetical protein